MGMVRMAEGVMEFWARVGRFQARRGPANSLVRHRFFRGEFNDSPRER
jgi:hypothetical protein